MPALKDIVTFGAGSLAAPWRNQSSAYYGGSGAITVSADGVLSLGTAAASAIDLNAVHSIAAGEAFSLGPIVVPAGGTLTMHVGVPSGGHLYRITVNRVDGVLSYYNSEPPVGGAITYDAAVHKYVRWKLVADGGASAQQWAMQWATTDPHLEASWTNLFTTATGNLDLSSLTVVMTYAPGTATSAATIEGVNDVGSSAAASVTLVGATRGAAAGSVLVGQTVKPVTVHVLDDDGAIATGYNGPVSMGCAWDDSLAPAPDWFTDADLMLDGTRTVQAVAGVALFSDLSLRGIGSWRFVPRVGA